MQSAVSRRQTILSRGTLFVHFFRSITNFNNSTKLFKGTYSVCALAARCTCRTSYRCELRLGCAMFMRSPSLTKVVQLSKSLAKSALTNLAYASRLDGVCAVGSFVLEKIYTSVRLLIAGKLWNISIVSIANYNYKSRYGNIFLTYS